MVEDRLSKDEVGDGGGPDRQQRNPMTVGCETVTPWSLR